MVFESLLPGAYVTKPAWHAATRVGRGALLFAAHALYSDVLRFLIDEIIIIYLIILMTANVITKKTANGMKLLYTSVKHMS